MSCHALFPPESHTISTETGSVHAGLLPLQLWKQLSPRQTIFPAFLKDTGLKSFILAVAGPDKQGRQLSKCLNIHPQQAKKLGVTKNSRFDFDN